ncbi:MAG: AAA family ATPase [Psychrobacillus sp.]
MFFLQMSGFPGSGKSTLARQIARRTGAVIVDHDIVKTALLNSTNKHEVKLEMEGPITYDIDWALIEHYLSLGHEVIYDCPCLYEEMITNGTMLAEKYKVNYKYVECYLNNIQVINDRLQNRERKKSQIQQVSSEKEFLKTVNGSKKPPNHKYLLVDSSQQLESYLEDVMHYLNS